MLLKVIKCNWLTILLLLTILTSCSKRTAIDALIDCNIVGIDVSPVCVLSCYDNHHGIHNDGVKYLKIFLYSYSDITLNKTLWNESTPPESLICILCGGVCKDEYYEKLISFDLDDQILNRSHIWLVYDRNNKQYYHDNTLLNIYNNHSINLIICLFDQINNTFHYFEIDT